MVVNNCEKNKQGLERVGQPLQTGGQGRPPLGSENLAVEVWEEPSRQKAQGQG
jgi:hypothetical protein